MIYDPTLARPYCDPQLFVDDLAIESAENVRRVWHRPRKHGEGPVLYRTEPWETILESTVNGFQVLRDPRDGLFKCWYMNTDYRGCGPQDSAIGDTRFSVLYAQSADGEHWEKPLVGAGIEGMPTNVVLPAGYGLTLAIDPHETDESQRFKGLYTKFDGGGDCDNVVQVVSPDGIVWRENAERPRFGRLGAHLDDVLVMHYDPAARIYTLATRHYDMYAVSRNPRHPVVGHFTPPYFPLDWSRMNKRRVWQLESADLIHWSEPYPILVPQDGFDELDEVFYGLSRQIVGGVHIGFLSALHHVSNEMRVKLVASRDGKTWTHLNNRGTFLNHGAEGDWDACLAALPTAPIEVGDELFFFYGGARNHHDWWLTGGREGLDVPEAHDLSRVEYAIGLAKLRLHGYCSLEATVRPGIVITRAFVWDGAALSINARCHPGGSIAVELVDWRDEVLPGYGRADCDAFTGDSVRHTVTWQGGGAIPEAPADRAAYPGPETGRLRKIRFHLHHAELFSFACLPST